MVLRDDSSFSITINPYGNAPLTAMAQITANQPVKISFEVMQKDNLNVTNVKKYGKTYEKSQKLPIYGLYEDYYNLVKINGETDDGNQCFTQYISLPTERVEFTGRSNTPILSVSTVNYSKIEPGWTMMHLYRSYEYVMLDLQGNLRYYLNHNKIQAGHIQLDTDNNLIIQEHGTNNLIYYSILGEKLSKSVSLEGYTLHHDFYIKKNGNILFLVDKNSHMYIEDHLIEYDPETKAIINEWDLTKVLPKDRTNIINYKSTTPNDWLHMNSIIADESDNTVIFSARHQGVFKITYPNNLRGGVFQILWILSPHAGFSELTPNVTSKLLKPIDIDNRPIDDEKVLSGEINHRDFEWNWGQHSAFKLKNGNLLVFDNGDNRNFLGEGLRDDSYSRVVEYMIDEPNMTVKQVWSYGKSRNDLYAQIMSGADKFEHNTNNYYMNSTFVVDTTTKEIHTEIREITFEQEIVYAAKTSPNIFAYRSYRVKPFDFMNLK